MKRYKLNAAIVPCPACGTACEMRIWFGLFARLECHKCGMVQLGRVMKVPEDYELREHDTAIRPISTEDKL